MTILIRYPHATSWQSRWGEQGRLVEAETWQLQILAERKALLGPDHPDVIRSMLGLSTTYQSLHRLDEAGDLLRQALKLQENVFGTHYSEVSVTSKTDFAILLSERREFEEAKELQTQVVKARQQDLGPEDPLTLASKSNLASIYWKQGKLSDAEEIQEEVVRAQTRVLGKEHP